ncbi:hypothetical protein [Streptomyces sp. NPDC003077]|uniref:hypothetical protein n=1 Tax=Streptomyces sp. NPDC003077 TaxID=3154443 RepID=UPI0033A0BF49
MPAPTGPYGTGTPAPSGPGESASAPAVSGTPAPAASGAPVVPGPRRTAPAPRRSARRVAAAGVCLVLGLGLLGGAAAGSWLASDVDDRPAAEVTFAKGRELWHTAPVDTLFPPTLDGPAAGPGGADRTWTRIAVAPDSGCSGAYDPLLAKVLAPVGCARLVRATYLDATRTSLVTVGVQTTKTDPVGMKALSKRFANERLDRRTDLLPRPYAAKGTAAAGFGPAQRASWSIRVRTDLPLVLYAVSGFADGRAVPDPRPAAEATRDGATSTPAQSGLGHDAKGAADAVQQIVEELVEERPTQHPTERPR